jgi:hypothetical protein
MTSFSEFLKIMVWKLNVMIDNRHDKKTRRNGD